MKQPKEIIQIVHLSVEGMPKNRKFITSPKIINKFSTKKYEKLEYNLIFQILCSLYGTQNLKYSQ